MSLRIFYRIIVMPLILSFIITSCSDVMQPDPEYRQAVMDAFAEDDKARKLLPEENYLTLLKERRFAELDKYILDVQNDYENDGNAVASISNLNEFNATNKKLTPLFNEWVDNDKQSWPARMARAIHYYQTGWKWRGDEYYNKVPEENKKQFRLYLNKSRQDALFVANKNSKVLSAHIHLISIAGDLGRDSEQELRLRNALHNAIDDYDLRKTYMRYLAPRWGGSHAEMRRFALLSLKYRDKNPRLYALLGYEFADKGDIAASDIKHFDAIEYYTKAIDYVPRPVWLYSRAKSHFRLGELQTPLVDLNEALKYSPNYAQAIAFRGEVYLNLNKKDEALNDFNRALELAPSDYRTRNMLGYLYHVLEKTQEAAQQFDKVLEYKPENNYALIYCGVTRGKLKQFDKALACVKKAVDLKPEDPDTIRNYGDVLHEMGEPKHLEIFAHYLKIADPRKEGEMYQKIKKHLQDNNYPIPEK